MQDLWVSDPVLFDPDVFLFDPGEFQTRFYSTPVQNQLVADPVLPKMLPPLYLSSISGTRAPTNTPILNPSKDESKPRLLHSPFKFNTTLPHSNQTLPKTTITLPQSNATLPLRNKHTSAATQARHQHSNRAGSHQRQPCSPESVRRWFGAVQDSATKYRCQRRVIHIGIPALSPAKIRLQLCDSLFCVVILMAPMSKWHQCAI